MKKFLLAGAALAALATGAQAADLGAPRTAIPGTVVAPAGFNWTGFYLGGHLGGAVNASNYLLTAPPAGVFDGFAGQGYGRSTSGFLGGVQLGYNWQVAPNGVVGIEGSLSLASTSSRYLSPVALTNFGALDTFRTTNPFLGNISVRAGLTADRALFFGKVGLAVGSFTYRVTDPVQGIGTTSATRAGLLLGAGLEYALTQNWTIGAEYNYNWFGSYTATLTNGGGTYRMRQDVHVGKITLNYLFSTGGAVSARY